MLVFGVRGRPEYTGKNLSVQSREPTNSIHIIRLIRKSNPGHIGGRRVLSPLLETIKNNAEDGFTSRHFCQTFVFSCFINRLEKDGLLQTIRKRHQRNCDI